MDIIRQNILDITNGIIVHQVNCQGVMGAGIALQIRRRWPKVYTAYHRLCLEEQRGTKLLGRIQMVGTTGKLTICNLFGQHRYGRNRRYTDYDAVRKALSRLAELSMSRQIYIPYNMGCANAGGDWDIVSGIIADTCSRSIVCKIPESQYQ